MYAKVEKKKANKTRKAVCDRRKLNQKKHFNTINSIQLVEKTSDKKNQWECKNCGKTGLGKAPERCKDCKSVNVVAVAVGRLAFGSWWESLNGEYKQELLRAHGSHEAHGGAKQKQQGGGGKGNQHSNGVATAMKRIREKYENGEYDNK